MAIAVDSILDSVLPADFANSMTIVQTARLVGRSRQCIYDWHHRGIAVCSGGKTTWLTLPIGHFQGRPFVLLHDLAEFITTTKVGPPIDADELRRRFLNRGNIQTRAVY